MTTKAARRLRDEYRKNIDEHAEQEIARQLDTFREAMMRRRRDPREIDRLARQLEARIRERRIV